ncbi:MAG: hypothetical protein KUL83_02165 [Lentimicrobium sp.]|nr:hypothetical protein [Lentimicrobium sp.]MDD2529502.1 hypothetical protein [Lentimicrobiaceae bacterium]MDD4597000.1 hypothetical protein [Lentimicrobiaceae bacterium]MDY0027146.1 hypothetical protein [Lentimicrobium sp.]
MKNIFISLLLISMGISLFAQDKQEKDYTNFISCEVDGKPFKAEARKMKIPISGFEYLGLAAFQVSPDISVWIRLYYLSDNLKPGTYEIVSEEYVENAARKKAEENMVWAMVDYSEETKGLGHAFHDGESLSGTVTIEELGDKTIKGSFEATLKGVYYKKRAVATMTGSGIKDNLWDKAVTKAGGGMLVSGPHDHDNTKKSKETDTIILTNGHFYLDWNKADADEK